MKKSAFICLGLLVLLATRSYAITNDWTGGGGTTNFGDVSNWSQDPEFTGTNPRVATNIHRINIAATVSTSGTNYNYVSTTMDHSNAVFAVGTGSSVTNAGGAWVEGTINVYGRLDAGSAVIGTGVSSDDFNLNVYSGGTLVAVGNNSFGGNANNNRDVTINLWGTMQLKLVLLNQWATASTNNNFLIKVHTGAVYNVSSGVTLKCDSNSTARVEIWGGYMDMNGTNNFPYLNVTNTPGNGIVFKSASSLIRVAVGNVTANIQDWIDTGAVSSELPGYGVQSEYNVSSNATFLKVVSLGANDRIWDGGGSDAKWTTAANWQGDTAPIAGDALFFAGSNRLINTNDFAAGTEFSKIVFNSGSGNFVLRGNAISFGGGITNQSSNTQTMELAIAMSGLCEVHALNGNVVMGGAITGSGGFNKMGAQILTLSGINTYSGDSTLSAGTLVMSGNHSGSSSALTISNGTLNVNSANGLGTGLLRIEGGTIGNTSGSAVTNSGNGAVAINSNFTFAGTSLLDLGNGTATFSNSPTITFSGTSNVLALGAVANAGYGSSNTRTITVSGATGTLIADSWSVASDAVNSTNVFAGNGKLTILGEISNGGTSTASGLDFIGSGTYTLSGNNTFDGLIRRMTGAGTLTLSGSNSGMSGGIFQGTLGTLNINHTHALGTGPVTINGGTFDNTSGGVIVNAGNNFIEITGNASFGGSHDLDLGDGNLDAGWTAASAPARLLSINGAGRTLTMGMVSNTSSSVDSAFGNRARWKVDGPGTLVIGELFLHDYHQSRGLRLEGSANVTINGPVGATGGGVTGHFFIAQSSGTVTMNGNTTYFGPTMVSTGGTLVVNGTILSNRLVATDSGVLYGTGSAPHAALEGGVFSPVGAGVGHFVSIGGTLKLETGILRMDIANAGGTAGTGWDLITVGAGGGIVTNAGGTGSVTVKLVHASSSLPGFSGTTPASWKIVDAGSQVGFSVGQFVVDTSEFAPVAKYNGSFSVSSSGGDVFLDFTPVVNEVDLSVTVIASTNYVTADDLVTVTVIVSNHSGTASSMYYVTNMLGGNVTILEASDGAVVSSGNVAWMLGNLGAGSSTSLTVTVQPVFTGSDTELNNTITAVVTPVYTDPTPGNNNASSGNVITVGIPMMSDLAMLLLACVVVFAFWRVHRRPLEA